MLNHPNCPITITSIRNIVYAARGSDVVMTMVDGRVLYENGVYKTLDIEKVIYETEKATKEILAEI